MSEEKLKMEDSNPLFLKRVREITGMMNSPTMSTLIKKLKKECSDHRIILAKKKKGGRKD